MSDYENNFRNLEQEPSPLFWSEVFSHFRWIIDKHENVSYYFLNRFETLAKILLTEAGFLLIFNAGIVSSEEFSTISTPIKFVQFITLTFSIITFLILILRISVKRKALNVDLPDIFHLNNAIAQIYKYPQDRFKAIYETMINTNLISNEWARQHQDESEIRFEQYNRLSLWAAVAQVPFIINLGATFWIIAI